MITFKQKQRQQWDMCAGFTQSLNSYLPRTELICWSGLGLSSLAIAGFFALLLAISRVPHASSFFPWPIAFFEKGLVIHVIFSFFVWFLSIFNALITVATYRIANGNPRIKYLGCLNIIISVIAFILLLIPSFLDRGEPSLNNYIPVIIDPLYYLGLGFFSVATLFQIFRLIINLHNHQGPIEPVALTTIIGSCLFVIAVICFFTSLNLVWGDIIDPSFNENIFWAPGHVLQFLNTLLMLLCWYVMGSILIKSPIIQPRFFSFITLLFLAAGAVLLSLIVVFDPISYDGRTSFTLAQYLLLPFVLSFFFGIAKSHRLNFDFIKKNEWKSPISIAFFSSIIVFGIGGILGIFVDGADTRTPAHYHGVIGGVNIAFIGLFFYFFVPILRSTIISTVRVPVSFNENKAIIITILCYGLGQILHSIGLFFAGGYGAPRKTPGDIDSLTAIGAKISLYAMGVGALIAVIGGIVFIFTASRALLMHNYKKNK